jgi:acetolactate synthase I/II/III large subunit
MSQMAGGQALVESLSMHGVDTLFVLPGAQNDALFNALYDANGAIRVIHTRHEQGAAYMAYGYAKSTGRVGAYVVVPGTGLLNTTCTIDVTVVSCKFQNGFLNLLAQDIAVHFSDTQHMVAT